MGHIHNGDVRCTSQAIPRPHRQLPKCCDGLLIPCARGCKQTGWLDGLILSEFTPAEDRSHVRRPFFDDPDPGPAEAWRWAHWCKTPQCFIYQSDRVRLRRWEYVLLDWWWLKDTGIVEEYWDSEDIWTKTRADENEEVHLHAEMQTSWEARASYYQMGARGKWDDESKII